MENKMLLLRRGIYILCVVLSLVFVTYYGGNLSYMVFYMLVFNTIGSIAYIIYVFFTIKIYQTLPERKVTKQEFVPYTLMLNNESFFAFRDVKLNFQKDFSEVMGTDNLGGIGLEPGDGTTILRDLFCKYSGTYYVGVDTIEIMDYFKIFRICFQMPQKMRVTVKPRVLEPKSIAFLTKEESHSSSLWGKNDFMLDNEVRKYYVGDNKRAIHWKNSAKRRELMVRNRTSEEISEYVVILDGGVNELKNGRLKRTKTKQELEANIICCDKLRECVLALVNYIYRSGYYAFAVIDDVYEKEIASQRDFNELYDRLMEYGFVAKDGLLERIAKLDEKYSGNVPFVLITGNHSIIERVFLETIGLRRELVEINVDLFENAEEIFHMES